MGEILKNVAIFYAVVITLSVIYFWWLYKTDNLFEVNDERRDHKKNSDT